MVTLSNDITSINWDRPAFVFERAPHGAREPNQLRQVFQNSGVVCMARDDDTPVGADRGRGAVLRQGDGRMG